MQILVAQAEPLDEAWRNVVTFVPRLLLFLVILLIGWILARAVATLVEKLLDRVGLDRAVERGGLRRLFEHSTLTPARLLARLIYYALLLLALQVAFGVFGDNPVSDLLTRIVAFIPRIFVAIIIVVIAAAIANAVRGLVDGAMGGTDLGRWLARAAQVAILVLGVVAALNQVGIGTSVSMPVLVAILATVGGVIVVGVGGGLVRPMQRRWERWLEAAEMQGAEMARARETQRRHEQVAAEHGLSGPVGQAAGTAGTTPPATPSDAGLVTPGAPTAPDQQAPRPAGGEHQQPAQAPQPPQRPRAGGAHAAGGDEGEETQVFPAVDPQDRPSSPGTMPRP